MTSLIWEIELKGPIEWKIQVVPELNSVYLGDQSDIGTTSRMKVRRFDMASGEQLADFSIRAWVNAMSFNPDHKTLLVNSDRRIHLLDSKTLKEINRWASRVPKMMKSILQIGRELAMKGYGSKKNVCLYNLDTMSVRRIPVGIGRPLFRDIMDDTFLACCEIDGTVCRVNPETRKWTTLFQGAPYNFCFADYSAKSLWLGEGLPANYTFWSGKPAPIVNNRIRAISLEDASVRQYDLDYEFHGLSVSKGGEFIWVRQETGGAQHEIKILKIPQGLREVGKFETPEGDALVHADAPTGLAFTRHRTSARGSEIEVCILRCWHIQVGS